MRRRWLLLVLLAAHSAQARPVTYEGGWMLMNENRPDQTEAMVAYTLDTRVAVGLHYEEYRPLGAPAREFIMPSISYLIRRFNENAVQANVYASAGGGLERLPHDAARGADDLRGAGWAACEGDIESRTLYVSARYTQARLFRPHPLPSARLRVGLTPYLTGFEGLQTWVLLQGQWHGWYAHSSTGDEFDLTPMLRFSYQNVLFELGASFRGAWQFNWVVEL